MFTLKDLEEIEERRATASSAESLTEAVSPMVRTDSARHYVSWYFLAR
jgi:hypothetical protein